MNTEVGFLFSIFRPSYEVFHGECWNVILFLSFMFCLNYIAQRRTMTSEKTFIVLVSAELRAQFLLKSLANLKKNMLNRGLNLLIKFGKPEEVLPAIVQFVGAHTVRYLVLFLC